MEQPFKKEDETPNEEAHDLSVTTNHHLPFLLIHHDGSEENDCILILS